MVHNYLKSWVIEVGSGVSVGSSILPELPFLLWPFFSIGLWCNSSNVMLATSKMIQIEMWINLSTKKTSKFEAQKGA